LTINITDEFRENGFKADDSLTKDCWFLKDLIRVYSKESGDVGATMTPSENMNLHAQIYFQL